MNAKINYYLDELVKNEVGASKDVIKNIQEQLKFEFPEDYVELIEEFDGGEGEVGNNGWLCLFAIEELISINRDYRLLMEQIPDYVLFGKDAADTGYAFHKSRKTVHSFGLMSNFKTDNITFCGNSIEEFIEFLYNG